MHVHMTKLYSEIELAQFHTFCMYRYLLHCILIIAATDAPAFSTVSVTGRSGCADLTPVVDTDCNEGTETLTCRAFATTGVQLTGTWTVTVTGKNQSHFSLHVCVCSVCVCACVCVQCVCVWACVCMCVCMCVHLQSKM